MILEHIITAQEADCELLQVLKKSMELSATTIKRLKKSDGIKIDDRTAFTNYRVTEGEKLSVTLIEPPTDIIPQKGDIEILYEDEGLIAVNKPSGMLVHPSRARNTGTLSNFVLGFLLSKADNAYCHTVNRLDRDTSGVVLFAKNAHMKNLAIRALKEQESRKEYAAIVYGVPAKKEGTIDQPIKRLRERDMMRIVSPQDGERAVTEYRVEAAGMIKGYTLSLMKFRLLTGRTHQIRVHCLASGFPILGDCLYSTPESGEASEDMEVFEQMLHSELLLFGHPVTGGIMSIRAPILRQPMARIAAEITRI